MTYTRSAPASGVAEADPPQRASISDADFNKFREFFYRKTGIQFDDNKRYFVDKRLQDRIAETGALNFREYFASLRFEAAGAEMQELVNAMTVNETYFFRETYQFDCMVNSLLNEIVQYKKPGSRVRIWSIPSSTGEEPYSIAIYLLERWPQIHSYDVEILSSDIDTKVLQSAQRGVYSQRSVGNLPKPYLKKYFTPLRDNEWQVSRDLVDAVNFSRVNLTNSADTAKFRDIDIVFCRNLLIYFDDLSRRVAAEAMYEAMSPGGFVCLGHSESMSRITSLFSVRRFPDAMVYQKPREGKR
jgi:chemotaxis protein methyltransferase CheR